MLLLTPWFGSLLVRYFHPHARLMNLGHPQVGLLARKHRLILSRPLFVEDEVRLLGLTIVGIL